MLYGLWLSISASPNRPVLDAKGFLHVQTGLVLRGGNLRLGFSRSARARSTLRAALGLVLLRSQNL
jgi:hypothetical protein